MERGNPPQVAGSRRDVQVDMRGSPPPSTVGRVMEKAVHVGTLHGVLMQCGDTAVLLEGLLRCSWQAGAGRPEVSGHQQRCARGNMKPLVLGAQCPRHFQNHAENSFSYVCLIVCRLVKHGGLCMACVPMSVPTEDCSLAFQKDSLCRERCCTLEITP